MKAGWRLRRFLEAGRIEFLRLAPVGRMTMSSHRTIISRNTFNRFGFNRGFNSRVARFDRFHHFHHHLDLVQYDGPMAGFHERTPAGGWAGFTRFKSVPNINTKEPNLRFVDVTSDSHPDILISEDTVFTWYESLAKDGFAPPRRAPKS
jgi:hypothetical protein